MCLGPAVLEVVYTPLFGSLLTWSSHPDATRGPHFCIASADINLQAVCLAGAADMFKTWGKVVRARLVSGHVCHRPCPSRDRRVIE